jgi:cobalamin biosynthesis Mg chelatase CobN
MPCPTLNDLLAAVAVLRRLIVSAEAGEVEASRTTLDQLRGAIAALEVASVTATEHLR